MQENNPNNLEGKQPLSPEDIEALRAKQEKKQHDAAEVLNAKEAGEAVPFQPGFANDELTEKTDSIAKTGIHREAGEAVPFQPGFANDELTEKTDSIAKTGIHREAGVDLEEAYPEHRMKEAINSKILNFKQKVEKVEELRAGTDPDKMMQGLAELHQDNDAEKEA